MFFIIGMVLGLLLIGTGIYSFRKESRGYRDGACASITIGCFVLSIFLIVFLLSQMISLWENTELLVMEQNIEAYQLTATQMNDIAVVDGKSSGGLLQVVVDGGGNGGLLQNMEQSSMTSLCIKEYRDLLVEYNKAISYRKVVQDNFWIGIFVVRLPPGIEPIEFCLEEYR